MPKLHEFTRYVFRTYKFVNPFTKSVTSIGSQPINHAKLFMSRKIMLAEHFRRLPPSFFISNESSSLFTLLFKSLLIQCKGHTYVSMLEYIQGTIIEKCSLEYFIFKKIVLPISIIIRHSSSKKPM